MERLVIWRGLDEWRAETAHVRIEDDRLAAHGTQLGMHPYRLDYSLGTGPKFVAERLELSVLGRRPAAPSPRRAPPGRIHFDDDGFVRLYENYLERVC